MTMVARLWQWIIWRWRSWRWWWQGTVAREMLIKDKVLVTMVTILMAHIILFCTKTLTLFYKVFFYLEIVFLKQRER